MSETAHETFGHELMMAHGFVCEDADDDLCDARFIAWDIVAQMRDNGGAVCQQCADRLSTL